MTARLQSPSVDAEVSVADQAALPQEASVGVQHLHHVRIIPAQAELTGTEFGDEWPSWIEPYNQMF